MIQISAAPLHLTLAEARFSSFGFFVYFVYMEINESSDYVKARALLLAEYFSQRGWLVTAGKNNSILIYVQNEDIYNFTEDQLMEIICESDWHIEGTGLKTSPVTYMFYHRGEFYKKFEVLSSSEYDIYDKD